MPVALSRWSGAFALGLVLAATATAADTDTPGTREVGDTLAGASVPESPDVEETAGNLLDGEETEPGDDEAAASPPPSPEPEPTSKRWTPGPGLVVGIASIGAIAFAFHRHRAER